MANTETLLELVFNNTAPSESIPPAEEVANVLRNAPVDNSTDSLQFDATTIVVESVFLNFNKMSHILSISYLKRKLLNAKTQNASLQELLPLPQRLPQQLPNH